MFCVKHLNKKSEEGDLVINSVKETPNPLLNPRTGNEDKRDFPVIRPISEGYKKGPTIGGHYLRIAWVMVFSILMSRLRGNQAKT